MAVCPAERQRAQIQDGRMSPPLGQWFKSMNVIYIIAHVAAAVRPCAFWITSYKTWLQAEH